MVFMESSGSNCFVNHSRDVTIRRDGSAGLIRNLAQRLPAAIMGIERQWRHINYLQT